MDRAKCDKCLSIIDNDGIACDGICGSHFHRDCIRRSTRQGLINAYTCPSCCDIKPCHILKALRLINAKVDSVIDKTSELEHSVASMRSDLNILFNDRDMISSKIDKLIDVKGSLVDDMARYANLTKNSYSLTKQLVDTISELVIAPDFSSLKEDIAGFSGSVRDTDKRIGKMTDLLNNLLQSIPTYPASCSSRVSSSESSSHCAGRPFALPTDIISRASGGQPSPPSSFSESPSQPPTIDVSSSHQIGGVSNLTSPNIADIQARPLIYPPLTNTDSQPPSSQTSDISWIPNNPLGHASLHVGRCEPSTTPEAIKDFVSSQLRINKSSVKCRKLVNPNRPLNDYSFVSFKVDIPSTLLQSALSHVWPCPARVSLFKYHSKHSKQRCRSPSSPTPKNGHNPQPQAKT